MSDTKQQPNEVKRQKGTLAQAFGFAWDFGIVIVVPLVALGVSGRFLDKRLGTSPWFLLGGFILSIAISMTLLVVRLKKIIGKITKQPPHE